MKTHKPRGECEYCRKLTTHTNADDQKHECAEGYGCTRPLRRPPRKAYGSRDPSARGRLRVPTDAS